MFAIFKNKTAASAAEIEAALVSIDIHSLQAELAAAVERRAALLLTGTDKEILAAEAAIDQARLAVDRNTAAKAELERRVVAARAAEAKAGLDAERDAAAKEAAEIKRVLAAEWPRHANPLIALLTRLLDAERAIERVNAKLVDADRADDRLREIERDLFADGTTYLPAVSLMNRTALPAAFGAGSWPTLSN